MISWTIWAIIFALGAIYEFHTIVDKRRNDTLTETTRTVFRIHTKVGRLVFVVIWLGFSVWFLGHILQWWP